MLVTGSICKTNLAVYNFGSEKGAGIKVSERGTETHSLSILFLELGISFQACTQYLLISSPQILSLYLAHRKKESSIIKIHCQF